MQFSSAIRSNLEAFSSNMKMPFVPQQDGSLSFLLSESGELTFTPANQGSSLVVSLGRAATSHSMNLNETLLRKAGFRPELGNNLHAARSKDGMAHLAVSYNAAQLSPALLEQTVDFLIAEMEKL